MEESQSSQDTSRFRAFSFSNGATQESAGDRELHNVGIQSNQEPSRFRAQNEVSGAVQESAGDRDLHNVGIASQSAGVYLHGSHQHLQGFSRSVNLYDEQYLSSALDDMTLDLNTHTAARQDDSLPLQISAAHAKQKSNLEHQEQGHGFPPHLGKFSRTSGQQSFNTNFGVPYNSSTAFAPPFQQHCYVDGQSQMYRPHDQNVSSNFIWQHDIQPYSVVQPQYICPQMQQISSFDVYQHGSNEHAAVYTSANVPSSRIGTPDSHGLETGYPCFSVAAFQKRNNRLNNMFTDSFCSTSCADSSCGSVDFHHFQQAEKFFHPSGQGFSHHQQVDNLAHSNGLGFSHHPHQTCGRFNTVSYPERILMSPDVGNSVRAIKFAPSVNGYADMDHRINDYSHEHLGIQRNNSMLQLLPSTEHLTVDNAVGRVCILAKDQTYCHFLTKILTEGTQEDADKVFNEMIDHIGELMMDPVANNLVQKILGTNDQRMHIIRKITKSPAELIKVCCNTHGTRVMQKVIETINTIEASMVVTALSHGTMRLMTDANGNHVLFRCLEKLLPEHKAFIIETAASRYLQLARDRHGCCVLQKCMEHSNDEQRNDLLSKITSSALRLSEDQYGNYVIQFILGLKIEWATTRIVDGLAGHFGNLSMQKCGSHVVEHCLKLAPQLMCDRIIDELIHDPKLPHIIIDQYGNFVIQTALKQCQGGQHVAFVEAIRPYTGALQSNMYGKRVLSKTYLKNNHHRFGFF
ncbi:hypothetical protein HU200_038098 [Digitaria exilis]|uniref:PUM-HD domain-containing protein n=1 Tax=Digitaria exilis TaxID=1010633 RepID=A0A835BKU4_9POAL|nr:hypothetical protein HU200_038098 [Digitaria exilis]